MSEETQNTEATEAPQVSPEQFLQDFDWHNYEEGIDIIAGGKLEECEKMVLGLEELFHKSQFSFKVKKSEEKRKTVDKSGHELIEFRGEKISGALDFVSKILEFNEITKIKSFITRIEQCNRRMKPILIEESEIMKVKLRNFDIEMKQLYPVYKELYDKNQDYLKEKGSLRKKLIRERKIKYKDLDDREVDTLFHEKFPEFNDFFKNYSEKKKQYNKLSQKIKNTKIVMNQILNYNDKIQKYFNE